MKTDLEKIIKHENDNWSKIFQSELENTNDRKFSSFWWRDYYEEISNYIDEIMFKNGFNKILEAGSGSGKATILLDKSFSKTLLDISPVALKYAKYLANKFEAGNINFIEGNILSMPLKDNSFNFVWNIGVIEHYNFDSIKSIIREMIRVCSENGIVAVGIPNFYSGPILKARLLKLFKFIPGYRIDTEKFYKAKGIENLFQDISNEFRRKIVYVKTEYFGNPLIMETPKFVLKTIGKLVSRLFVRNKFLLLITCKFE